MSILSKSIAENIWGRIYLGVECALQKTTGIFRLSKNISLVNTPDEGNHKFVAENYVNIDFPEGKYDLLFRYKGKVAYFINVNLTLEPTD